MEEQSNKLKKTCSKTTRERIKPQSNFYTLTEAVDKYKYPVTLQVIPSKAMNLFSTDGRSEQFERHVVTVVDFIKNNKITCVYKCENTTFTMKVSDYPVHVISIDAQCCFKTLADVVEFQKERHHDWFVITKQFMYNDILYPIGQVVLLSSQKNLSFKIPFNRKEKNIKCILYPSEKKIALPGSVFGNFYPCDRVNFLKITRMLSEVVETERLPFFINFPSQVPGEIVENLDIENQNILVTDYCSKGITIACKQSNDITEVYTIPSHINPTVEVLHGETPVVSLTKHEINIIKSKLIFNDFEKAENEHQRCDLNSLLDNPSNEILEEDEIDEVEYTNVGELFENIDEHMATEMHNSTPEFLTSRTVMSLKSIDGLAINSSSDLMRNDETDSSKSQHNRALPNLPSPGLHDKNNIVSQPSVRAAKSTDRNEIPSQNKDDEHDQTNVGESINRSTHAIATSSHSSHSKPRKPLPAPPSDDFDHYEKMQAEISNGISEISFRKEDESNGTTGSSNKLANSLDSFKDHLMNPKLRSGKSLPSPPSDDFDHYEKMQASSTDDTETYIHFLDDDNIIDEEKSHDTVKSQHRNNSTDDANFHIAKENSTSLISKPLSNKPPTPAKKPAIPGKKPAVPRKKPKTLGKKTLVPEQIHRKSNVEDVLKESDNAEENYYQNEWDTCDDYENEHDDARVQKTINDSDYDYSYMFDVTDKETGTSVEKRVNIKQQLSLSKIGSLSVGEVINLLKVICLDRYCELFKYHEIDGELLVEMDEEALKSLGLTSFEARKLHQYINGWRPNQRPSGCPDDVSEYTVTEISSLLKKLKMFEFSNFCLKSDVDGQLIRALTFDEMLLNLEEEHKIEFKKFQLVKLKQIIQRGLK